MPLCAPVASVPTVVLTVVLAAVLCCASPHAYAQAQAPVHSAADAHLTSLSLEQLMQISITGASKYEQRLGDVAASVSVITRQQIKAFGWRTVEEALASLPGVFVSQDRQYRYLGVRGLGLPADYTTRVLFMVNGIRLNEPLYDAAPLGYQVPVPLQALERIEFIPGPAGAVYGQNAMFAVVNLVTQTGAAAPGASGTPAHGGITLARDNLNGQRTAQAHGGVQLPGGLALFATAHALRATGQDWPFDVPGQSSHPTGTVRGQDGERAHGLFASAQLGHWRAEVMGNDRRKGSPLGIFKSDPYAPGQNERDAIATAQLRYDNPQAAPGLQVSARVFSGAMRFVGDFTFGQEQALNPTRARWAGGELQLLATQWQQHKVMLGLELQRNHQLVLANDYPTRPEANVRFADRGYRHGLYVQDEWQWAPTATATLGLRLDRNNSTGTHASPRLGVVWHASPATTWRALAGRAHRAPTLFERRFEDALQVANPALPGETITTTELVADHRVSSQLQLRLSAYRWALKRLIVLDTDPASGVLQFQPGQPIRTDGIELQADHTWASGARLRGHVSSQRVQQTGSLANVNSPKTLAALNLSTPLWGADAGGWRLGYEWQHGGSRPTLAGPATGAYSLSNLHLATDRLLGHTGWGLALTVHNLLDKSYQVAGGRVHWQNAISQDGRSVRLALTYGVGAP
jgi:outer membrane receptor protein involved in Fe transport